MAGPGGELGLDCVHDQLLAVTIGKPGATVVVVRIDMRALFDGNNEECGSVVIIDLFSVDFNVSGNNPIAGDDIGAAEHVQHGVAICIVPGEIGVIGVVAGLVVVEHDSVGIRLTAKNGDILALDGCGGSGGVGQCGVERQCGEQHHGNQDREHLFHGNTSYFLSVVNKERVMTRCVIVGRGVIAEKLMVTFVSPPFLYKYRTYFTVSLVAGNKSN